MLPVRTQGPNIHWHGDGPEPEGLLPWQRTTGNPSKHINRAKYDDDHRGTNTEALHSHQSVAKYVFVNQAKIDKTYDHDHDTSWRRKSDADRPAHRKAHVAKQHDGLDICGLHTHTMRVKDPNALDIAKRIDVHPMAVESVCSAEVLFFVIEGCPKADAVLADGGAVFSVPSVTLWDCVELRRFAEDFLIGKVVVIVNDADWEKKPEVLNQARMCQIALYRLGVRESHVAAPPAFYNGRETKGADDLIGAGGHLEDLRVIDSDPPTGLHAWIAERTTRWDQARRDEEVLWALSCYSGSAGIFSSPLKTLARVIGMNARRVSRAIEDLERLGAVVHEGDTSIRRNWFSRQYEWDEVPTITLIPELRSTDRPEQSLGDLVQLPMRTQGMVHAR